MSGIVGRVQTLALALGAPGLFFVAFLDSSILSLPEVADLLLIWMVTQHKSRLALYAASATLGSIAGCLLLYYIGRKGGEALVRRRFSSAVVDRTLGVFHRYGIMAVLIPSILPPPAPFKIFVLLAGAANVGVGRFSMTLVVGRGVRYFVEGLLGVWYGDRAVAFIHENGKTVSLTLAAGLLAGLSGYILWTRARTARRRYNDQPTS